MAEPRRSHVTKKLLHLCSQEYRRTLWRLRGALQDEVTTTTKHGRFSFSTEDNAVGASLYIDGKYEDYDYSLRTLRFLRDNNFVPTTKIDMLDVGANIGVISIGLILAGLVDRAVAVEPEPKNFGLLCRNIEQNSISDQVLCLQMAVGETTEDLTMELSPDNFGDHRIRVGTLPSTPERLGESQRKVIQVPSLSLPELLKHPEVTASGMSSPSLMWIDVQGFEGYVFKGAASMLSDGLPTVSEVWPYGILRAGMSLEQMCEIVANIWSDYWIERRQRFIRYPIAVFDRYLEELGTEGHYENVVFTTSRN